MAKKKYLKFYQECLDSGRMPDAGLCICLGKRKMEIFQPIGREVNYYDGVLTGLYWASDVNPGDSFARHYGFSPTRQNIVLFLAAMNNEL
jgi:hypothetical protein